ncbi:MAG: hypothetical protein HC845_10205 [Akkermansiaceae bacterium]|nr:hypothetical protein [Akkermansiaceae bacterium]
MTTQFLTNQKGKKVAAVIPIKDYQNLMEDLEDLAMIASRRDDETITFEELKEKLIKDGLLPA